MSKRTTYNESGASRRYPRLVKWTFRFFSGIAVAIVYFIVFSFFFDTPIEYELKKSTERIATEYEALERRYDTLQQVLNNVSERDKSIYTMLFEAEPVLLGDDDRQHRLEFRDRLEEMSNLELGNWFDEHLGMLYQHVSNYNAMVKGQQERVAKNVQKALSIPAIQPVANKNLKQTASGYGMRIDPIYKTVKFHAGMDFSANVGTPVYVTGNGKVKQAGWDGLYGNCITVDHGFGYVTRYAHLSKIKVKVGQEVVRGEVIGEVGSTGKSTGPHLHYEVHVKGQVVNPVNYYFMDLSADEYDRMIEIASNHGKVYD